MSALLVIDDDRSIHYMVKEALADISLEIWSAFTVKQGLELVVQEPDAVLLDIMLPDCSGLECAEQIAQVDAKLPIIFVTGRDTSDTAIQAMKLGAYEYLLKPLDFPRLRACVEQAIAARRLTKVPLAFPRDPRVPKGEQLIGRNLKMQNVYKAIGRVASQNVIALIHGESGTGKELVARAIYQHSDRAEKPFLAINCAAIPEPLLESELFGYEKGAFTNALQQRLGKFEQCSGGTIFLDEVGDMSPSVQGKVLRLLQEQKFERVGGTETIHTDVRLIAATNRDLKAMVGEGTFREDLYYRLSGYTINLPPLRERGDDLLLFLQHFLDRFNFELRKDIHGIAPDAFALLSEYSWPGNVRELKTVMLQSMLQTPGSIILADYLPETIRQARKPVAEAVEVDFGSSELEACLERCLQNGSHDIYYDMSQFTERFVISRILQHTRGNQSQAAKLLGITRGSLRRKIRLLGITLGATVTCGPAAGEARSDKLVAQESCK